MRGKIIGNTSVLHNATTLVIHCSVTTYSQSQQLNIHKHLLSPMAASVRGSGPHRRISWGCIHDVFNWGWNPPNTSVGCRTCFQARSLFVGRRPEFLTCCWPEPPFPSWVSLGLLTAWKLASPRVSDLGEQRHPRQNRNIFYKLILEVMCHCFCHIPLVTETSKVWEGTTQLCHHWEAGVTEHHLGDWIPGPQIFLKIILLVHDIKNLETSIVNRT